MFLHASLPSSSAPFSDRFPVPESWAFLFQIIEWFYDIAKYPLRIQKETIKLIFTFAQRKTLNPGLQQWKANAVTHSSVLLPFHLAFQPVCSVGENSRFGKPYPSRFREARGCQKAVTDTRISEHYCSQKPTAPTAFQGTEMAERTLCREEPAVLPELQLICSYAFHKKSYQASSMV